MVGGFVFIDILEAGAGGKVDNDDGSDHESRQEGAQEDVVVTLKDCAAEEEREDEGGEFDDERAQGDLGASAF